MGLYRNLAYFSVKTILILQQRLVRLSPECFIFLTQTQIHAAKVSSKKTFRCNDTHMKNWNLWIKSWAGNHHLGRCCWISSTNFFYCSSFHSHNFRGINTCRKQQVVKAMRLFLESFLEFFWKRCFSSFKFDSTIISTTFRNMHGIKNGIHINTRWCLVYTLPWGEQSSR